MSRTTREAEFSRIKKLPTIEDDPHRDEAGVLLSDEIEFYVQYGKLIDPFSKCNLKAAGCELTVGDEVMLGGKYLELGNSSKTNKVCIPSFEVAVIKTAETVNLPRFLIARWNIRVAWAYKGLLWVGGPQVDPGFVGHLFCPIYNLSNKNVWLRKGDPLALMDFVKTTPYGDAKTYPGSSPKPYNRPPSRVTIDDYGIDDFRSALFSHGIEVQEGLKSVQNRFDFFIVIIFTILAIFLTALGYLNFGGPPQGTATQASGERAIALWELLPLALSFFAVMLSLLTYKALTTPILRKPWVFLAGIIIGSAATALVAVYS